MEPFDKTTSFCPTCKKIIDTDIIEKDGAMFMQKKCPEHGEFELKIAKYAWYYKGLNDYYDKLYGGDFGAKKQKKFLWGLLTINSECNLKCPICHVHSENPIPDPPRSVIREKLEKIKNKGLIVQISGGEPTLREDLPEIIDMVVKSGNLPSLNTNGVKIAEDFEYLKKLHRSGLRNIVTWMDTLNNPEIYKKIRGGDFLKLKEKFLKNIRKLKINTMIVQVPVRDINESEIGDCLEFARKNKFIHTLWIKGYNYFGRCGFSLSKELLQDELAEIVANQSKGLFNLEDLYFWQKMLITISVIENGTPCWCYYAPSILIPRHKEKSLAEIFNFKKFSRVFDNFEKIWPENSEQAKRYFLSEYYPLLLRNSHLSRAMEAFSSQFGWPASPCKHYCAVIINKNTNIFVYDFKRIKQQCVTCSLDHDPSKEIPRCYAMVDFHSPSFCKTQETENLFQ